MGVEAALIATAIGGVASSVINKPKKPKVAKQAPPVSAEDPNVRQAAKSKQRQLSAASRASARSLQSYGSKLG